jgi:glycosyltransferase involved in cell wall biosynthesis
MDNGETIGRDRSISAVMAVYNPDLLLFRKAVSSVLEQSLPVLELVVVNDGGGDDFRGALPQDDRIRVFSKPNEGVANTRNYAISHCRGEYIAFLDQDDCWYPDKLSEQMAMVPLNGAPCMVISMVDVVDASGRVIQKQSGIAHDSYLHKVSDGEVSQGLADDNFIFSSTPLIHRAIFRKIGGFDADSQPHDDWDMYLRIALSGYPVYCYTAKALSVWRIHDANESHKRRAMLESRCRVAEKMLLLVKTQEIERIFRTNMSLDHIDIDALLYKDHQYRQFRTSSRQHFPNMLKMYMKSGRADRFAQDYRKRWRETFLKLFRRYLFSFYFDLMK